MGKPINTKYTWCLLTNHGVQLHSTFNGATSIKKHVVLTRPPSDHFQLQSSTKCRRLWASDNMPSSVKIGKGADEDFALQRSLLFKGFCLHHLVHWLQRWPDEVRRRFNDNWGRVPLYD